MCMNLMEERKKQTIGLMLEFIIEIGRRKGTGAKTKPFSGLQGHLAVLRVSVTAQRQQSLLRTPKMLHTPDKRSENFGKMENRHLRRQWQTLFMVILGGPAEGVIGSDLVGNEQGGEAQTASWRSTKKDMSAHYRQYLPG